MYSWKLLLGRLIVCPVHVRLLLWCGGDIRDAIHRGHLSRRVFLFTYFFDVRYYLFDGTCSMYGGLLRIYCRYDHSSVLGSMYKRLFLRTGIRIRNAIYGSHLSHREFLCTGHDRCTSMFCGLLRECCRPNISDV